ncbi:fused response regulator/phosphatase [Zoogloea sp.]|uniref:ATP-binding SpoIIE family protein phosphatase n=1 Tax=Zoogloea sp. TaxID=49181 RepID=UPI0011D4E9DA|nr:fused response regulator/phosphatase [Zoogloea sp.]MBK6656227.1 fused response regulator/phosphatase [Zoogloea sp.]MBP7443485.1 fused response regulator/phosphatase [Zoogloea sp.]TXG97492.1 MAG: response regulator [Zoogloea sp.]HOY00447.1 fused response regulator/phosphatase [Zoogloea sp.]HPI60807.1 fused response regulator/phosphatase [Zoogloea sp.]
MFENDAESLFILVVDDNPDDLYLIRRDLLSLGHRVAGVSTATEALEHIAEAYPDVLMTDVGLPGMDGIELLQTVRARTDGSWIPSLVFTGSLDEATQMRALEAGADAYLCKPASREMLHAKLGVILRLKAMQRQAEARNRELARYRSLQEEEQRLARFVMERLINREALGDPAVSHWIASAAEFSGDLIAAARTPGNVLHVLLADGAGHGLAASLNVLPVTAPFYRMTERGFGIDAIAREINSKVRALLPVDRFIAATLVAVNFRERYMTVWNGGNPGPLLVRPDGGVRLHFNRHHFPLGVVDDDEFDGTVDSHVVNPHDHLLLFSDGLIELEDAAGQALGVDGLGAALQGLGADLRLPRLTEIVHDLTGGNPPRDDISIAQIALTDTPQPVPAVSSADFPAAPTASDWRLVLRLGAADLKRLDAVPLVLGAIEQFEGVRPFAGRLFLVLSELFNNALDHGLLRLPSSLKVGAEGMDVFLDERARRLARLEMGAVEFELSLRQGDGQPPVLHISCADTGPGFDHEEQIRFAGGEPSSEDILKGHGRGIPLLLRVCEEVRYSGVGNRVDVLFRLAERLP